MGTPAGVPTIALDIQMVIPETEYQRKKRSKTAGTGFLQTFNLIVNFEGVKKNKKMRIVSKASKTKPIRFFGLLAALALILLLAPIRLWAGWLEGAAPLPVVVLDPGHGGNDAGAHGPSGLKEKDVTLAVARALSESLAGSCRMVLTRDDDYGLSVEERTSIANHNRATLFISLHNGAGSTSATGGMAVYFCGQVARETLPEADVSLDTDLVPWRAVYLRHQAASRRLARLLINRLEPLADDGEVDSGAIPLLVLKGADMPAVLVETGCLTNPVDEQKLADPDYVRAIAAAIAVAVRTFFKSNGQ